MCPQTQLPESSSVFAAHFRSRFHSQITDWRSSFLRPVPLQIFSMRACHMCFVRERLQQQQRTNGTQHCRKCNYRIPEPSPLHFSHSLSLSLSAFCTLFAPALMRLLALITLFALPSICHRTNAAGPELPSYSALSLL